MAKIFMPEITDPVERLELLKQNADKAEKTTYYRELTQDELDSKREQFVDNAIRVSSLEDELTDYKEKYKALIKPHKDENSVLQVEIKTGKAEVNGTLFHMANHSEGYMETYDENGEMVQSRRLRPDEKQGRLFVAAKAANE